VASGNAGIDARGGPMMLAHIGMMKALHRKP
jgi:hypothetical protein